MNRKTIYYISVLCLISLFFINLFWDFPSQNGSFLLYQYRLPKLLTALFTGASLPVSGMLLQCLFQNPIAGPSVLGVSSMAGLGVALLIFMSPLFFVDGIVYNSWFIIFFSLMGAILGLLLIQLVANFVNQTSYLLIIGMLLASFSSALISVLQYLSSAEDIKRYFMWTLGSFEGLSWEQINTFGAFLLLSLTGCLFLLRTLNLFQLGEIYAHSMGVNVVQSKRLIILVSGILIACTTAFVGPIAFVGFAIPHLSRAVMRTTNHVHLLPSNILFGSILMLMITWMGQLSPLVLPINLITTLFGIPIAVFVLLKQSKKWIL